MKIRWKIMLCLVGVVLLSALVGAKIGGWYVYNRMRRHNNPATWNETAMRVMDRRLHFTPEQRQKIQASMDAHVDELTALREETIGKTNVIMKKLVDEISAELTPEQRAEFDKLKDQQVASNLDRLKVEPRKH